jgi:effector-binding domain-containing protein
MTMTYEMTIKHVPPRHVARLRRHTTMAEIGPTIREAFMTIGARLHAVDAQASGPPFNVNDHVGGPEDRAEFEVCVPIGYSFPGDDEVVVTEMPGVAVAATVHHGSFEEVGRAYEALYRWIEEQRLVVDGPAREVYLTDPETTPDPADFVTEIEIPVR